MNPGMRVTWGLSTLLVTGFAACSTPEAEVARSWSPKAAAAYLDQRADWWMGWQGQPVIMGLSPSHVIPRCPTPCLAPPTARQWPMTLLPTANADFLTITQVR